MKKGFWVRFRNFETEKENLCFEATPLKHRKFHLNDTSKSREIIFIAVYRFKTIPELLDDF